MDDTAAKATLHHYLQSTRDAMLWKLDGLSEYDARRPLVPTGTNLLGLVKHASGVEMGYFGDCFGRPFPDQPAWMADDAEDNADMWATAEESREDVVGLYRRVWQHADATIEDLALDATGEVPWWQEGRRTVTLHQILVHVISDLTRHAGHADLVRELVDGSVGWRPDALNLPAGDETWWRDHRDRLESVAREAGGPSTA